MFVKLPPTDNNSQYAFFSFGGFDKQVFVGDKEMHRYTVEHFEVLEVMNEEKYLKVLMSIIEEQYLKSAFSKKLAIILEDVYGVSSMCSLETADKILSTLPAIGV